ncbi:hypothetical protein FOZ63_000991, partial [Perkinsus olseni]
ISKQLEEKITSLLSADIILAEVRKEAEKVNQSQVPEMRRSSSVIQKLQKDDSCTRSSGVVKCSVRSQATEVYSAHNGSSVAPTQGNGGSESSESQLDDADSATWSRNALSNQRVVNEHSPDDASPASDQDDADSTTWSRNALSNQEVVNERSVEAAWSVSNQDVADSTSWSRNCSM